MKHENKQDEYLDEVSKFAEYINRENKTIGISANPEIAYQAEKSIALKRLKGRYKFTIQMVIT